jgi:K+-transporting ATPase A subunit
MNKLVTRLQLLLLTMLCSAIGFAQDTGAPEMADTMRSNGKIYVVVVVCLVILVGLFLYMIRVDRKVRRLEKETAKHVQ